MLTSALVSRRHSRSFLWRLSRPRPALSQFDYGDGAPDLVIGNNWAARVTVLLNAGDGSFGPASSYAPGFSYPSLALGDVAGDGALNIAAAEGQGNR